MNAIDNINRKTNEEHPDNWQFPISFIKHIQLPTTKYAKTFLESNSSQDTAIKNGLEYLESTGIIKYIDFLTSHKEYNSLIKQNKTPETLKQIKKIENSAIHGNRYNRKFKNWKKLRNLVNTLFNSSQEKKDSLEVSIHENTTIKYNNRKNFLKFGALKIKKNFNEYALNDFLAKGAFETCKQKKREEAAKQFQKKDYLITMLSDNHNKRLM